MFQLVAGPIQELISQKRVSFRGFCPIPFLYNVKQDQGERERKREREREKKESVALVHAVTVKE